MVGGRPTVKVLYIAGSSRCGSTILGNILGELDGFFNGGEIRFLWSRALQGRRCGCQRPVDECPVWKSVLPSEGRDRLAIRALDETQRAVLRLHHTPGLLRRSPKWLLRSRELAGYVRAMAGVYERLADVTQARVIVDSSKRPSNAAALRLIRGIDPYLIHLVRDARGVAYSRLRGKANPDGAGEMPIVSSRVNAVDWMATNLAAEDVRRHWPPHRTILLRYEDFVADPRIAIDWIAAFVGERVEPDPFLDANTVKLGPNHTVSGNPDRFQHGSVTLRADVEWLDGMSSLDRRVTGALTFPLLLRYRYPFRPAA
jgi:hypothetical protein